jgi:hypothetical protein
MVSKTLSLLPCTSPPPPPRALALVFTAPTLPIEPPDPNPDAFSLCVRTAELLESLDMKQHIEQFMCVAVDPARFTASSCCVLFPPFQLCLFQHMASQDPRYHRQHRLRCHAAAA